MLVAGEGLGTPDAAVVAVTDGDDEIRELFDGDDDTDELCVGLRDARDAVTDTVLEPCSAAFADDVATNVIVVVAVASTEPVTNTLVVLVAVVDAESADDTLTRKIVDVGSCVDVTELDDDGVADTTPVGLKEHVALRVSPDTVALTVARGDDDDDTDAVPLLDTPVVDVIDGLDVTRTDTDALRDERGLAVTAPAEAEPLGESLGVADADCSPDAVRAEAVCAFDRVAR